MTNAFFLPRDISIQSSGRKECHPERTQRGSAKDCDVHGRPRRAVRELSASRHKHYTRSNLSASSISDH
jgi:hypothetical protein